MSFYVVLGRFLQKAYEGGIIRFVVFWSCDTLHNMREFNVFGPVNPQYHYHVDRISVKNTLREKIAKGRYLTLTAARQTGKTTLLQEVIAELDETYFGVLLNFELLAGFEGERFYERLSKTIEEWRKKVNPMAPEPSPMRDQGDFAD